jgi:hypothetical protein
VSGPPLDEACPRCGTAREPGQEYCLECGLKLPATTGTLARARRGWVRRIGWYPGDWFWTTLLALVVAAAGAAVAIVTTHTASGGNTGTTFVATSPSVPLTTPTTTAATPTVDTSTLPTPPEPSTSTTTTAPSEPQNGQTPWPAGSNGWTVVLVSLPASGNGQQTARAQARHAVSGGLPEVGILDSSRFSSLHPGYLVLFSGIYDTQAEARSSVAAARGAGFSSAYVRQIAQ